jgi:hypothetical protein
MLKSMKPAINAIRVVAMLEDTPGLGPSLLRRTKTMCGGAQRILSGLSTRELSAVETQTELRAALKEMVTPIQQILKNAYKGVAEAKAMAALESQRQAAAATYSKEQLMKRRREEADQKARDAKELAAMTVVQQKERIAQMAAEKEVAVRKAREEAERKYIDEAIKKNPHLKTLLLGEDPEPVVDLMTAGFAESEEGLYDTGAIARAGFAVDGAAQSAKEREMDAKKDAFIAKLRQQQDAMEAAEIAASILAAVDEAEADAVDELDVWEN